MISKYINRFGAHISTLVSSAESALVAIPQSISTIEEIEEGDLVTSEEEEGILDFQIEMLGRRKMLGFLLYNVLYPALMLLFQGDACLSLNVEGHALMEFRLKIERDPHGVFNSWNPSNGGPCSWWGIYCIYGKVEMLNLNGLSLGGTLSSELGKLSNLKYLVLSNNNFSGTIPKEFGQLTRLELLDLRSNDLSGKIPEEMMGLSSLKHLWLCNNRFEDDVHLESVTNMHSSSLSQFKYKRKNLPQPADNSPDSIKSSSDPYAFEIEDRKFNIRNFRRKLLLETHNLPALPIEDSDAPIQESVDVVTTGSGSFPAIPIKDNETKVPEESKNENSNHSSSDSKEPQVIEPEMPKSDSNLGKTVSGSGGGLELWVYTLLAMALVIFLVLVVAIILKSRNEIEGTVGPWKTGLSGQLQKAFVAGVPKLNRSELEAACEDFSNIIESYPECTVYKGTLSSGVEIAVFSTIVSSSRDWSEQSEEHFHKKIDMLSRVNHKNLVNLLGYCEEEEPFMRVMVFEYAPNGNLFEHLHVKGLEHLDWSARMRIIMGIAYCVEYMHHELNPPSPLSNLDSTAIFLTDDRAAKVMEMEFWKEFSKGNLPNNQEASRPAVSLVDLPGNVYSFGTLMLEIISGKPPQSKEHGSIVSWAVELLEEKGGDVNGLIDPTLQSAKNEELEAIHQVIMECINPDPKSRPTMRDITSKLRDSLGISSESAAPRLSPLWWAELEILSVEAS